MTEILSTLTAVVPVVVTSAIAVLAVIAPLTNSDIDNKVLDGLRWLEARILGVLFPTLRSK